MAYLRFWQRIPIIPGFLYLNISKTGISFSFGPRGAKLTVGKDGARGTLGLPGTGLSVSKKLSKKNKNGKK